MKLKCPTLNLSNVNKISISVFLWSIKTTKPSMETTTLYLVPKRDDIR